MLFWKKLIKKEITQKTVRLNPDSVTRKLEPSALRPVEPDPDFQIDYELTYTEASEVIR